MMNHARRPLPSQPFLGSFVPFFTKSALKRFIRRRSYPCLSFLTISSLLLNLLSPLVAPSSLPVVSAETGQSSSRNNAPLASSASVSASPESDSAVLLAAATATVTRQPTRTLRGSTPAATSTPTPTPSRAKCETIPSPSLHQSHPERVPARNLSHLLPLACL